MELLTGGRLSDLITRVCKLEQRRFTDNEASSIIRAILQGLSFMHSFGLMHRDLKPQNIMLADSQDLSSLKIVDFGLSKKYSHRTEDVRFCGTRIYMAPEVIMKQNECTKSVDIWAVGIIMYEVLTGGLHPLCTKGDTRDTYEEKIRRTKGLKPHSSFSVLSRHLFQRLTEL